MGFYYFILVVTGLQNNNVKGINRNENIMCSNFVTSKLVVTKTSLTSCFLWKLVFDLVTFLMLPLDLHNPFLFA